jgi:CRISPR-associated protein Cmr3
MTAKKTAPRQGSGQQENTGHSLIPSSKKNPCPICGRTKDGDCRTAEGLVICHHGSSHHPPEGLRPGDVIEGRDGQQWAFTKETTDGRGSTFTLDKPRHQPARVVAPRRPRVTSHQPAPAPIASLIELARLPKPGKQPPAHLRHGQRITYSPTQWVEVIRKPDGSKAFMPSHTGTDGKEVKRKGSEPWPLWREAEALEHGPGQWITEAEGEKCAGWLRAAGLVAVSQPGHDHSPASIERRYRLLLAAGVVGVLYLADKDPTGDSKAKKCAAAAAAVGLPLVVVPAAEVWPGLPVGGSIDDAPGTATERAAALVAAIPAAVERHQQQKAEPESTAAEQRRPLTMTEVGGKLRVAISEGMGAADLAALVAMLASASGQNSISVKQLADAIRAEQLQAVAVAAEAQQIAAERDRQEIGQLLSAHYLLPASIAAAIETRTRYLPCDATSAVLPFLATVAGLVKLGTEVEASNPAGYRVPVNLFACLVGRSGAKKSPIGRLLVEAPTADLRADLARANQREREAWAEQCRELKKGEAKPPAPFPRRLSVSDFTGEALAAQLQAQEAAGLGLLVHRDELSGLFGSLNQYRGGKGGDEQQLLELFDGSGLSSLRIVGDRHYSRSQLSIWGSTQPDVLRQLVANGDASGLWARFLFVPLPERAVPLPLVTSAAEVAEVEAAAATLANACGAVYRLPPQTYRLAPAAAERFAHYELNRQRAALRATIGAQSALYGKSAGKVLRLAGVLHLLQIAAGEISSTKVEPGTIERAAALVDHLDAWALSLHAEVAAGGVGQLMRTVHRAAEAAAAPIRWKELAVKLSARQRKETDAAAFAEAAQALAAAGYGEVEAGKRGALSYRSTRALP